MAILVLSPTSQVLLSVQSIHIVSIRSCKILFNPHRVCQFKLKNSRSAL